MIVSTTDSIRETRDGEEKRLGREVRLVRTQRTNATETLPRNK